MDTGKNKLSQEMFEKLKECISNKEYSKSEDILYLVEGETITDNHNRRLSDPSIFKLHGKMLRGTSDEVTGRFQEYVESETGTPPYEMVTIDSIPELIREQAEYDSMMYGDTYIFGVKPKKLITGCTKNFKPQQKIDMLEALYDILDTEAPDRNGRIWKREFMNKVLNNRVYLIPPRHHKSWLWMKFLEMQSYEIQHKPLVFPPSTKVDLKSVIHMRWPKPDLSDLKPEVGLMDHIIDTFGPIDQMTLHTLMRHWPELVKKTPGPNLNDNKKTLERVIKKGRKRK